VKYTEQDILEEALEHFDLLLIHRQQAGFEQQIVIDAVCMRLLAGIDTLSRLSDVRLDELFGDDWRQMRGTRNRIAHGYGDLNFTIIASTVDENVPDLIAILRRELGRQIFRPDQFGSHSFTTLIPGASLRWRQ
jgi:uncharacterized protein with HEPN domain